MPGREQKGQSQPSSESPNFLHAPTRNSSALGFDIHTQCGVPLSNYPELCLPPTGLTCITIETSMLPAASTHAPATCLREEVLACFFHLASNAKKATVFRSLTSFRERGSWQFHTSVER